MSDHEDIRIEDAETITELSVEMAEALIWVEGEYKEYYEHLNLNGLTSLSDGAAEALGEFWGELLSLKGLTSLSSGAAEGLGKFKGDHLDLDGLTSISDRAATALRIRSRRR
jgi:hypothetical protein